MEADYSLSVGETFTWASRVCIELDGEFNCLAGTRLNRDQHSLLPSWVPDWRDDDALSRFQDTYRKLDEVSKNPERLRLRSEHGRKLDRKSIKIEISGEGIGRLEIDKDSSIYLVAFPRCVMETFKSLSSKILPTAEFSRSDFFDFYKKTIRHDTEECNCMNDFSRIRQDDNNMPKNVETGDWVLSRAASGAERCHYVLRPVEVAEEVTFKLVQRLNWFVDERDDYDEDAEEASVDEEEDELEDEVEQNFSGAEVDMDNQIRANRLSESVPISDFVRIRTTYVLV